MNLKDYVLEGSGGSRGRDEIRSWTLVDTNLYFSVDDGVCSYLVLKPFFIVCFRGGAKNARKIPVLINFTLKLTRTITRELARYR
jgi:hypothetical protein